MDKLRAALYIRVSTEEQAMEGYSLDAQEKKLLAYCQDVADDVEVYDIYRDDGYSGRNTNRPGDRKMMEDIDEWYILVVLKRDRIHRNFRNFILSQPVAFSILQIINRPFWNVVGLFLHSVCHIIAVLVCSLSR